MSDNSASRRQKRKAWLTRREALRPAAESFVTVDRLAAGNASDLINEYHNKAKVVRELLLFINRQIVCISEHDMRTPSKPNPAGYVEPNQMWKATRTTARR